MIPFFQSPGQDRKSARRERHSDPFYQTVRWRKLRRWFMRQPENAWCAECESMGVLTLPVVCDHIIPRQVCPEREMDPTNLQALCRPCDNRKRARDIKAGLSGRATRKSEDDEQKERDSVTLRRLD